MDDNRAFNNAVKAHGLLKLLYFGLLTHGGEFPEPALIDLRDAAEGLLAARREAPSPEATPEAEPPQAAPEAASEAPPPKPRRKRHDNA